MSRKPFVAGNWKMNKSKFPARDLARGVVHAVRGIGDVDIAVAPTFVTLEQVGEVVRGTNVALAAQNMHWAENGAYTGEISPTMLCDFDCRYVILGHSERREHFLESDKLINEKVRSALSHELRPIVCVGESLDEREGGRTREKVDRQVRAALDGVSSGDIRAVTIAYEPIWAIGTGRTASPEQAQEVHAQIRSLVEALYDRDVAQALRIQYGGSVKPDNIAELIAQRDIDGALVGGASLDAESFAAIIRACSAE